MTHDELLTRIDKNWDADYDYCDVQRDKALRAVVELHKPNARGDECANCGWECGKELLSYPCPTIQAIEKELA